MSTVTAPVVSSTVPHEILIGFSSPDATQKALECAKSLAHRFGSHVTVAHVGQPVSPISVPEGEMFRRSDERAVAMTDAELDQAVEDLRADGLRADRAERWGGVSQELQELAREKNADLLVLGTHSPRGLDRLFCGSVAEETADRSGWPVMIVGPGVTTPHGAWSPGTVACFVEKTPENVGAVVYGYRLAQELDADLKLFAIIDSDSEGDEFAGSDRFARALSAQLPGVDLASELPVQKIWHSVAADYIGLRVKMHDLGAVVMAANNVGPLHSHLHRDLLSVAVEAADCPVIVVARSRSQAQA